MSKNISRNPYEIATGEIPVTLRNDLMFHHVMQTSNNALKSLVCAAKGFKISDVKDVVIQNPIEIDESVSNEIILDVLVTLNNNENLDIELQLYYDRDWINRSLLYLCRTFDSSLAANDKDLRKYERLKPTTLVAIIDKNICFPEKEFYSTYQLLNVKSHHPYSSHLTIKVLNLSHIELATDDDINSGLLGWAKIFLANTWKDISRIVEEYPFLKEVAMVMYEANADIKKQSLMRAHEEYLMRVRSAESYIKEAVDRADRAEAELAQKNADIAKKDADIAKKDADIAKKDADIAKKDADIADKDSRIRALEAEIEKLRAMK